MGIETAIIGGALIGGGASVAARQVSRPGRRSAVRTRQQRRVDGSLTFSVATSSRLSETGQSALARLRQLFGLSQGNDPGGSPDFSAFEESPGFQFRKEQGEEAIGRSLAARGKALSGQGVKESIRFASGLASQEFGSFFDRLGVLAGIGQTGAAQSAAAGATSASQVGNAQLTGGIAAGNARASAFAGLNNAFSGRFVEFSCCCVIYRMLPDSLRVSGGLCNGFRNIQSGRGSAKCGGDQIVQTSITP